MMDASMSRRRLLQVAGAGAASLVVSSGLASSAAAQSWRPRAEGQESDPRQLPAQSLPDWYDHYRVRAYTRQPIFDPGQGGLNADGTPTSEWALTPQRFADLGARTIQRHVSTGYEDPWYPSAAPTGPEGERLFDDDRTISYIHNRYTDPPGTEFAVPIEAGADYVQELIDDAHNAGLRFVAYYWHMADQTSADLHPEWRSLNRGSDLAVHQRGIFMDLMSDYRDVVATQLLEIAAKGADAFYFDLYHVPLRGSFGSATEQLFRAEHPDVPWPPPINEDNPVYQDWLDFRAQTIVDTFAYWKQHVHAVYPDVVFMVKSFPMSGLGNRWASTDLARVADSLADEWQAPFQLNPTNRVFVDNPDLAEPHIEARRSFGWVLQRDSADGRVPDVVVGNPSVGNHPDEAHVLGFTAGILTHGAAVSFNFDEHNIDPDDGEEYPWPARTSPEDLQAAFALGDTVAPHLAGTDPVRWAAVHFSESQRNARGGDFPAMWVEVLSPMLGAYKILSRAAVPVGSIDDHQLANGYLDDYSLLFLSNRAELSAQQAVQVDEFEAAGGVMVENDPAWDWSTDAGVAAAEAALSALLQPHLPEAPVRVEGGPELLQSTDFLPRAAGGSLANATRLVVAVSNDPSFLQQESPEEVNPPPPPAHGVQVTWRSEQSEQPPILEAVSRQWLVPQSTADGYTVTLPDFQTMALLVVTMPAAFEQIRLSVNRLLDDGQVTRAGAARLRAKLAQAERSLARGSHSKAVEHLASFTKIVADGKFVPGMSARDALMAESGQLITQLGGPTQFSGI